MDKHDAELFSQRQLLEDLRSEVGLLRKPSIEQSKQFGDMSSDTASTFGSLTVGPFTQAEWCPRTVLVRGWAPFGSQKIDRIEYKKVANELLSCLPLSLRNNVVVRAPFAANYQISFGIKGGGGWESCRAVQEALIAGVESNMIDVRGHPLKVSIELSPRRKITLSNMFKAESFLKKSGVLSVVSQKLQKSEHKYERRLGRDSIRAPMHGCGTARNVLAVVCRCRDGKTSKVDYLLVAPITTV